MRSGGSSSRGFGGRSSSGAAPPRSAPRQAPAAPQQKSGGMMSGLGGVMMQGMAFGAGSEVAHRVVGGMMGGSGHQQAQPTQQYQEQGGYEQQGQYAQQEPCMNESQNFMNCLSQNQNDVGMCQNFMDLFKNCNSGYMP